MPFVYHFCMGDVTQILEAIENGDPSSSEKLLPLVYEELRLLAQQRLANEKSDQSLQATALVHEAYLRLVGSENGQQWNSRGHFFGAASEAMRRILINRARDRNRLKRGGGKARLDLSNITLATETPDDTLIELDNAIEQLAEEDEIAAKLVKLKFFAGLSMKDAAESLGMTRRQGDGIWAYARAWLFDSLRK